MSFLPYEQLASNIYYDRIFDQDAAKILPGEYYCTQKDMLIVTVLGSCVAACIRDRVSGVGGMNHFMLPGDSEPDSPVSSSMRYGTYAMEMLIRVLVLELIPLTATLFVAMRCTIPSGAQLALMRQSGHLAALRRAGSDPVRIELLPRVVAGVFASVTLAALSCVVALVMVYLSVYGFNAAGLASYTRVFGQVFSPAITLVFVLKTLFSSMAVALIPMAAGMYDTGQGTQPDSELGGLARMFAVLLLIEVGSLMGNYY